MKVYFAASTANLTVYGSKYKKIISILREQGNTVLDSWNILKLENRELNLTAQELLIHEKEHLLDSDIVVAEVSTPSIGVGYQIGQALFHKKPILCLYFQDVDTSAVSDVIIGSTSGLITSQQYTDKNVERIIREYLAAIRLPTLSKFNFLITPDVEEYLKWGSNREKKSKAQFLRDKIIRDLIEKDSDFKKSH